MFSFHSQQLIFFPHWFFECNMAPRMILQYSLMDHRQEKINERIQLHVGIENSGCLSLVKVV